MRRHGLIIAFACAVVGAAHATAQVSNNSIIPEREPDFDDLDVDRSGNLSFNEYKTLVRFLTAPIFRLGATQSDVDQDRFVSSEEAQLGTDPDRIAAYNKVDANDDGIVSVIELTEHNLTNSMATSGAQLPAIFAESDVDGNGNLTRRELENDELLDALRSQNRLLDVN